MLPRSFRPRRFTLIELLVVVAVIAILAAMLLPVLGRAKFRANMTVCLSNIRQTYLAMHMYGDDYEGWYPLADEGGAWPAQPPNYYSSSWGDAGPPGVLQTNGYASYQVVHCPGTGGLSNFGWPKPGWGAMDYFLAYDFVQLRRCDLWVGQSWRQDMTWSNSWAGGLLLRCLTVNNEGDPRGWTHREYVMEMRNDGVWRERQIPVLSIDNCGTSCETVVRAPSYTQRDTWWMSSTTP